MKLGVTGHRPSKLNWGYDYSHPCWVAVEKFVKNFITFYKYTDLYTGMALGFDTICALAVMALRSEGVDVNLHCIIPCQGHSSKWPSGSVRLYERILSGAQEVVRVTDAPYKPYLMQKRNEYIVDHTDNMLALFDGSKGGTGNCVNYATRLNKHIYVLPPSEIVSYVSNPDITLEGIMHAICEEDSNV